MKRQKIFFILLLLTFFLNTAHGFKPSMNIEAPYNIEKFQSVLNKSKLQGAYSATVVGYGKFHNFSSPSFYLSKNRNMTFSLSKVKVKADEFSRYARVELRQGPKSQEWKTSSPSWKKVIGDVKLSKPELLKEFTWMQIHDSTKFNKPLIRLLWKKKKEGKNDHLWAVLRTSLDKKYKWYDLGLRPKSFFEAEIKVRRNQLIVTINKEEKINQNVSYWKDMSSYFKTGLYLSAKNDEGAAKIQFKTLNYY